ncbi:MAG: ABC transporter permease [Rikenellaceae bacterium]
MNRGFNLTFIRELRFIGRDKTFSLAIIFIPIITFFFLTAVFYNGVPTDMPIGVVDNDNTPLSRQLIQMVDAGQAVKVAYDLSSVSEGRDLMFEGKLSGILVVPVDFERKVFRGEKVSCSAFISGLNILVGTLIERDVTTTVQTFSTGIEIQKLVSAGKSKAEAYNLSMPIYFDKHILFNPYTSYAYYLLPGFMPMMLLLIVLLSSSYSIGTELKEGTASIWLSSSGGSIFTATMAKLLPYTIIFIVQLLVMNVIMYNYLKVPLNGNIWLIAAANLLFVLAYQMVGVLITVIFANMRFAMSICAGYGVLAFSFSGLTFPIIAMSDYIAPFSNVFPLKFYMNVFIDQAMRGAPDYVSYIDLAVLMVFILIPLLSLLRLKVLATNKKYWGKS